MATRRIIKEEGIKERIARDCERYGVTIIKDYAFMKKEEDGRTRKMHGIKLKSYDGRVVDGYFLYINENSDLSREIAFDRALKKLHMKENKQNTKSLLAQEIRRILQEEEKPSPPPSANTAAKQNSFKINDWVFFTDERTLGSFQVLQVFSNGMIKIKSPYNNETQDVWYEYYSLDEKKTKDEAAKKLAAEKAAAEKEAAEKAAAEKAAAEARAKLKETIDLNEIMKTPQYQAVVAAYGKLGKWERKHGGDAAYKNFNDTLRTISTQYNQKQIDKQAVVQQIDKSLKKAEDEKQILQDPENFRLAVVAFLQYLKKILPQYK